MTDHEPTESTEQPEDGTDVEQPATHTRKVVRRKPSPTPFDHPLSFPLLCAGFAGWFGYDWLFNPKIEHKTFNQVCFWIFLGLFLLTIRIGLREMRLIREKKRKKAEEEMLKQAQS